MDGVGTNGSAFASLTVPMGSVAFVMVCRVGFSLIWTPCVRAECSITGDVAGPNGSATWLGLVVSAGPSGLQDIAGMW